MGSDASVTICEDANGLAESAAQLVVEAANEAVEARGRFMLCLAGGETPRATDERATLPATMVRPRDGELIWLVDRAAASLLQVGQAC